LSKKLSKSCQKNANKMWNGKKLTNNLSLSCQKVVKKCQKIVKKYSKSCQKVVKKLSKSCKKINKEFFWSKAIFYKFAKVWT
jgi:hypothetical protein